MPKNDILAQLRTLVDAGAPQKPVVSGPRSGTISKPGPFDRPMPFGDELLARARTLPQLLNESPLGLLGDASDPVSMASGPPGIPGKGRPSLAAFKPRQPMPSEGRMGELMGKFGGGPHTPPPMPEAPLPMDEASRMQRRIEGGYTTPGYHATKENFTEFSPAIKAGSYGSGDFGIHIATDPDTANAASHIADPQIMAMNPDTARVAPYLEGKLLPGEAGANVMPLWVRMNKALELPDMGIWRSPVDWSRMSDELVASHPQGSFVGKLRDEAADFAHRYPNEDLQWQHRLKELLQGEGYDSIRYANHTEGAGEPSFMLLDPRQLRSRFAAFDPRRKNSRDLLASLAAAIGTGAVASHEPEE